jgi:hypothetical protein
MKVTVSIISTDDYPATSSGLLDAKSDGAVNLLVIETDTLNIVLNAIFSTADKLGGDVAAHINENGRDVFFTPSLGINAT